MTRPQRFLLFLSRLQNAPGASSQVEALTLIADLLTQVEDEQSGVPNDPDSWQNDGRLYPPQEDHALDRDGGLVEYRSVAHSTFVSADGAILILRRRTHEVSLSKASADGRLLDVAALLEHDV